MSNAELDNWADIYPYCSALDKLGYPGWTASIVILGQTRTKA